MKLKVLILLLTVVCCRAMGQEKLPAFLIVNTDGSYMHNSVLPVKKSVILIYFQPDCEECRRLTGLLMRDDVIIRRQQVLMITNADLRRMQQFVAEFKLKGKTNVIVGTEGWTGTVQRKLNISRFPTVVEYDKDKMLRWRLTNDGDVDRLYDQLKRLSGQRRN